MNENENPRETEQGEPVPLEPDGDETTAPVDMNPWPSSPSSADRLEEIRRRWRAASDKKNINNLTDGK